LKESNEDVERLLEVVQLQNSIAPAHQAPVEAEAENAAEEEDQNEEIEATELKRA